MVWYQYLSKMHRLLDYLLLQYDTRYILFENISSRGLTCCCCCCCCCWFVHAHSILVDIMVLPVQYYHVHNLFESDIRICIALWIFVNFNGKAVVVMPVVGELSRPFIFWRIYSYNIIHDAIIHNVLCEIWITRMSNASSSSNNLLNPSTTTIIL